MLLDQDSNFRFKDQDHKNVVFDLFLEDQDQYLNHENMILDSRTKTKKQWSQERWREGGGICIGPRDRNRTWVTVSMVML